MNILFVCTGNTCRSPMAEGYLNSKNVEGMCVKSRGTAADGMPVSINAVNAMKNIGIDISSHISKQIIGGDILWADKIICMSPSHKAALESCNVPNVKLYVLGGGISDPYGGNENIYKNCRDEIISAIDKLLSDGFFGGFRVVPIGEKHIKPIAMLERVCFSQPWSAEGIVESYKSGTVFFAAENSEHMLGYIGIKPVLDEGYITNVAVFPQYRRQGVASALIERVFELARERKLSFVSLEVRVSNINAVSLYEKYGFKTEGRRRDFYRNPREDAYIMTKRFENNEDTCD